MWDKVGIIRNQEGLTAAANILAAWPKGPAAHRKGVL